MAGARLVQSRVRAKSRQPEPEARLRGPNQPTEVGFGWLSQIVAVSAASQWTFWVITRDTPLDKKTQSW